MGMAIHHRVTHWLETHGVAPAYSGWLMLGLALFFFAAATNTMAGWLYVISGVMVALLAIAAILPERTLRRISLTRAPLLPVTTGEPLTVELTLTNRGDRPKTLLQLEDVLPAELGTAAKTVVELLPAQGTYTWRYDYPTRRRGVLRWQTVHLRTATPLGLFWCRRSQAAKALAIIYPTVLPLAQCPLVDAMGREVNAWVQHRYQEQGATEGVTRTLRPYRWGDPTRLIHWRTSARFGELRVRELETFTGGQEIVICLDSATPWDAEYFEQAVIAAASIYFYGTHCNLQVSLWTAASGQLRGRQPVLERLAAVQPGEVPSANAPPDQGLLWLTQNSSSLASLPSGSRWMYWGDRPPPSSDALPGLIIRPEQPLQRQLQAPLSQQ